MSYELSFKLPIAVATIIAGSLMIWAVTARWGAKNVVAFESYDHQQIAKFADGKGTIMLKSGGADVKIGADLQDDGLGGYKITVTSAPAGVTKLAVGNTIELVYDGTKGPVAVCMSCDLVGLPGMWMISLRS